MIYDLMMLFQEIDLLNIHLHNLDGVVDRFVIAEAPYTHSGLPKPLNFLANQERFADFLDRIVYIVVDDLPPPVPDAWFPENFQRDALIRGLTDAQPDDIVLVGDVDEIVDVKALMENIHREETWAFEMPTYFFSFNGKVGSHDICTIVTHRRDIHPPGPHSSVRRYRHSYPNLRAGWHYSYAGDLATVTRKIEAFGHQDLNTFENKARLEAAMREHFVWWNPSEKWEPVALERGNCPDYLYDHRDQFKEYIFPV